ncbi:MAG: HD-GYP domain-containing protein [Streptosporangiaceae bacterium]
MRGLPRAAWALIITVSAVAAALIATGSYGNMPWTTLVALVVLFLICDSAPAQISLERARVSLGYAAGLASVVLLGPTGAAVVGASAIITMQAISSPVKRLYNSAQFALCGWAAGLAFDLLAPPGELEVGRLISPFAAALITYVGVNLALAGAVLSLSREATLRDFFVNGTRQLAPSLLGFGSFGLLIAGLWPVIGAAAFLVLLPLFVARWAFTQTRAEKAAHEAVLAAMCQAVETKDYYTRGHCVRVSQGSVMIAEEIGMRADRIEAIRYAGMLHDVGKLGVPTKVLQKDGPLTEEEYAAIQLHPVRGKEIISEIGFLDEALLGIMHHHEKLDGRGYPLGLAGEEIPEFARIIGVADAFDAMTTTRSYRPARPIPVALAELKRCAGTDLDPVIVTAFLRALDDKGWEPPGPVVLPEDGSGQVTNQDHDDPSAPIQVSQDTGGESNYSS